MQLPIYAPEALVLFKLGKGQVFGKILGGTYDLNGNTWIYYISNAANSTSTYSITEKEIIVDITSK